MSRGATIPGFDRWRSVLRAQEDECPWPGPRPYVKEDTAPLVGRDEVRQEFLLKVTNHRLVFLTGASGVGKSSLLTAGLLKDLTEAEYEVIVCGQWQGSADHRDATSFLASRIHDDLQSRRILRRTEPPMEYSDDVEVFFELEQDFGQHAVIVLDQFEELLRWQPALRRDVLELLHEIHTKLKLRVVISFREEAVLQLRWLASHAMPYQIAQQVLEPVSDYDEEGRSNAYHLAIAANTATNRPVIDDDAARRVSEMWIDALESHRIESDRSAEPVDPFATLGMLDLQALLYVLHVQRTGPAITRSEVEEFAAGAEPAAVFAKALTAAIQIKLERCQVAAAQQSPYLVNGAVDLVARAVRHLSSSGYKLEREAFELAEVTLAAELAVLRDGIGVADRRAISALFAIVLDGIRPGSEGADDRCVLTRGDIAIAADAHLGTNLWTEAITAGEHPAEIARLTTSGPLMDLPPAAVLIEELRRFALALAWLNESTLVRLSSPGTAGTIVGLIHDRFGDVLRQWSDDRLNHPQATLHALTAPRGASLDWNNDARTGVAYEDRAGVSRENAEPRVIANLRWRGAGVMAFLRNVVFVNCDLRGAYFHHCHFDGVTFVNCVLEGVVITRSVITAGERIPPRGGPARIARDGDRPFGEPAFVIDGLPGVAPAELADLAKYRGAGTLGDDSPLGSVLLSPRSGVPALPGPVPSAETTPWTPHRAGIAIYGGRVSSLFIERCTGGGDIVIRHAAGSGVDLIEHDGGRFELHDVLLRHVRFTAPTGGGRPVHVRVADSVMSQVWLGASLRGDMTVTGGMLVQAWNAADRSEFKATVGDAKVYMNVGFEVDSGCRPLDGLNREFAVTDRPVDSDRGFAFASQAMDLIFAGDERGAWGASGGHTPGCSPVLDT